VRHYRFYPQLPLNRLERVLLFSDIYMIVRCPTCGRYIEILQLNCAIFRCGIFKDSYKQLPPHSSQEECEQAIKNGLIFGCGKPFEVIDGTAVKSDYK